MTRSHGASLNAAFTLLALTACSITTPDSGGGSHTPVDADVDTTFTRIAPSGYIDLSLDFDNPTSQSMTLDGRLVARDSAGAELPGVRVTTAFGMENGRALLMPGVNVDFVQLDGPGEAKVRDVTLEDASVTSLDGAPPSELIELTPLDAKGGNLDYDMLARQVRLVNSNPVPVRVRIVLMVLRAPQEGVPQEATLVHDAVTVELKANRTAVVDLDPETRRILRERGLISFVTLRPVLAP